MCGIAGYFGSLKLAPSSKNINNCLKLMKRRGPDHQNFNIQNFKDRRMITLHSRLSIIDPNKISNQPMEDDTGIIAFNGEIYNYLELKKQLNLKNLKTNSDTEVLMKYLKIKKNVPDDDLDGMWAYSYFDKNSKKLFLSRDRFGEKPLYYKIEKDAFYYGSDINYIIALSNQKKIFDETKIYSFISLGFKSLFLNDNTFIKNIKVFPPSHVMQIDFQNNKKLFRYWNYKKKKELTKNYTYKEAKNITKNLIKTEFKKRYRSDFKISCLLSGGIDSTAIAACSYNNKTSLDFF